MDNNQTIASQDKVAVTLTIPNPLSILQKLKDRLFKLFSFVYNPLRNQAQESSSQVSSRIRRLSMPKLNFNFNRKRYFKFIFPLVIGVVIIFGLINFVRSTPDAQSNLVDSSIQIEAPNALQTINLDRKFTFPLRDEKGKEVGSFEYIIQSASIQKQIIAQGKRATAVNGRVFLILNLKIVNNLEQSMELPVRGFVRVIVNNNEKELLAPDIHNDPVEVQATSTKYTRLGLAINEADAKNTIKLQVGEIGKTKQIVELKFK